MSDGIAQVMSECVRLSATVAVEIGTPLPSNVVMLPEAPAGAAPTCQSTCPVKASTTRMPRPLVRLTVVLLDDAVGPMVHDPLEVYVTVLPLGTTFCFTLPALNSSSRQGLMSSTVSS